MSRMPWPIAYLVGAIAGALFVGFLGVLIAAIVGASIGYGAYSGAFWGFILGLIAVSDGRKRYKKYMLNLETKRTIL